MERASFQTQGCAQLVQDGAAHVGYGRFFIGGVNHYCDRRKTVYRPGDIRRRRK